MTQRTTVSDTFVLEMKVGKYWDARERSESEEEISLEYEKMVSKHPAVTWRIIREIRELICESEEDT